MVNFVTINNIEVEFVGFDDQDGGAYMLVNGAPCYPLWRDLDYEGIPHLEGIPPDGAEGEAMREAVLLAVTACPEEMENWDCGFGL